MTALKRAGASCPASPEAWVVVADDPNGGYLIRGQKYRGSKILRCFLSPFDALIKAHLSRGPTQTCRVLPATNLDPRLFRTGWLGGAMACVHLAWLAYQGGIRLRPDGKPASAAIVIRQWTLRRSNRFDIGRSVFSEIDRLHQAAGLFAWQETFAQTASRDAKVLWPILQHAVRSMPIASAVDAEPDQYALFDPEFCQWHFVPRVAVDSPGPDSAQVASFGDEPSGRARNRKV